MECLCTLYFSNFVNARGENKDVDKIDSKGTSSTEQSLTSLEQKRLTHILVGIT